MAPTAFYTYFEIVQVCDSIRLHFRNRRTKMEVKTSSGMLMKNTRKQQDSHPDYTGSWVSEDGVEHYLDGWINTSKAGNKYIKIRMGKAKDQAVKPKAAPARGFDSKDEDIPF